MSAETDRACVQALYDATTYLQAVLTFACHTSDLLSAELDYACRRLMHARSEVRRAGLVTHVDAGQIVDIALPVPFDKAEEWRRS